MDMDDAGLTGWTTGGGGEPYREVTDVAEIRQFIDDHADEVSKVSITKMGMVVTVEGKLKPVMEAIVLFQGGHDSWYERNPRIATVVSARWFRERGYAATLQPLQHDLIWVEWWRRLYIWIANYALDWLGLEQVLALTESPWTHVSAEEKKHVQLAVEMRKP